VRVPHVGGEDEGGPLARCTEEVGANNCGGAGSRPGGMTRVGARSGGVRTGETEGGINRWGLGPQCPV
jgi:hypothetical protein